MTTCGYTTDNSTENLQSDQIDIQLKYVNQELKKCHSGHPGLDPGPRIQGNTADTLDTGSSRTGSGTSMTHLS